VRISGSYPSCLYIYRVIRNSLTHFTKSVNLNGGTTVKCDLQMERETAKFFAYLVSALCVRPLWRSRRQADNPFPPIAAAAEQVLLCWPPPSPDLTPWEYIKDSDFLLPIPLDLPELRRRIIVAISETDRDFLQRVRAEMDYRLDVCRVTKGEHVERLWGMQTKKNCEFVFPAVGCMLQSIPPFKCTDFVKCGGDLRITLYFPITNLLCTINEFTHVVTRKSKQGSVVAARINMESVLSQDELIIVVRCLSWLLPFNVNLMEIKCLTVFVSWKDMLRTLKRRSLDERREQATAKWQVRIANACVFQCLERTFSSQESAVS
jgi:hypothetical protein